MRSSIIIVAYNGQKYLRACIESVLEETKEDDEIILVDNSSTDGSVELVRKNWPQVRLLCNESNLGYAAACNQGAGYARGETLVFLNQDTRVLPGWLAGLQEALEREPAVGLVTSKLLIMSEPKRIHMCGQEVHYTGFVFGRGFGSSAKEFPLPEEVGAVSGASFAIRRKLWEQLGGFDPMFYMYYEETDLCLRVKLAGYSSLYSPSSVVYHDYSQRNSSMVYANTERNRILLVLKNWKSVTMFLMLPSLVLAEIIDWGYMLLVGWGGIRAKVGAWRWLVRNFPAVMRARGMAQSSRREPDWTLLESCTYRLSARTHTGGGIGRMTVAFCNLLFSLHYKVILLITRNLSI